MASLARLKALYSALGFLSVVIVLLLVNHMYSSHLYRRYRWTVHHPRYVHRFENEAGNCGVLPLGIRCGRTSLQEFRGGEGHGQGQRGGLRLDMAEDRRSETEGESGRSTGLPDCSQFRKKLAGLNVTIDLHPLTYFQLRQEMSCHLQHGGRYTPDDCHADEKTAIIIPCRDRRRNLMILLRNLIPFLIRQRIQFSVFVVQQTSEHPFNRCLLFNVGFVESQKLADDFTCFIIHDTDLIPRRYDNVYRCHDDRPRHFVINRTGKTFPGLPYKTYIGGVLALRRRHMEMVNGCSNSYYGWGFEDDDLYERFRLVNMTPVRYDDVSFGEYVSLDHDLQPRNKHKHELLSTVEQRMSHDGLSSLNYTLEDCQERELFTWMLVRVPPPPSSFYAADSTSRRAAHRRRVGRKKGKH